MPSGRARFIENHDLRYKGRDVSDVRQPTIDRELGKIFGCVLRYKGRDVSDVRQPTIDRELGKIFGCVTRIIGLVIILREKIQESFVICSVAALQ